MKFLRKLGFHRESGCYCRRCGGTFHRWSEDRVQCLVCGFNPSKLKAEKAANEAKVAKARDETVVKYVLRDRGPKEPEERESVPLAETKEMRKFRKEMEDLRRFRF